MDEEEAKYTEKLTVTNDKEFDEALRMSTKHYLVDGVTITGKPADDPLGILNNDYIYICYDCQEYVQDWRYDEYDRREYYYEWRFVPEKDLLSIPDTISVGGYELQDPSDFSFEISYYTSFEDGTYLEKYKDNIIDEQYYYPDGQDGTIRYRVTTISSGDKASFVADLGLDEKALSTNDIENHLIVINGDADDVI